MMCRPAVILLILLLWLFSPLPLFSQGEADSLTNVRVSTTEDLGVEESPQVKKKKPLFQRIISPFEKFFLGVDTNYVEQSQYNFQALEQMKYNYETYRIKSEEGMSIGFSPRKSLKIGPYVGWSIIFVGVSVDLFHMADASNRREWDLSLYTLPFVLDIYYREGGSVCKIDHLNLGKGIDTSPVKGLKFDEFDSDIYGFDLTYIFNHKKFSYPAAYNQGAPQKKSSGSALVGFGFTQHRLRIDWQELEKLIDGRLPSDVAGLLDSLHFDKVTYTDLSISGGYAYNFVFARHWLLAASLSIGVSYKHAVSDTKGYFDDFGQIIRDFRDFKFSDISFDFTGRVGIVYNNGKWFAGASALFNSYNYSTDRFSTSSNFGTIDVYVGFNFGKKKQYKNKKT